MFILENVVLIHGLYNGMRGHVYVQRQQYRNNGKTRCKFVLKSKKMQEEENEIVQT